MIKDASANFARDRNLPSFSAHNRLQNIRNLRSSARMSRFGTEFDPLKKGLGIVDVNVLYHSLLGLASPQQVLGLLAPKWRLSLKCSAVAKCAKWDS